MELGWGVDRNVRIWHLGSGEARGLWESRLASMFWTEGSLHKRDDRGREVWQAETEGESFAVKSRPLSGVGDRMRFRFGSTDLGRSVLGAAVLTARGFQTPKVRVLGLVRTDTGWAEVLVTDWAEGQTLLSAWAAADERARSELARRAGEHVGRLAHAGLFNRDAKPSNVVIDSEGAFVMLDVGGVRLSGGDRPRELARMLGALGFEPTGVGHGPGFWQVFACVRAAVRGSGVDRRGDVIALLRRQILDHPNPAPKDNPLAQEPEMR